LFFERGEFGEEAVELRVGHGGCVEDVVVVVGAVETVAEMGDTLGGGGVVLIWGVWGHGFMITAGAVEHQSRSQSGGKRVDGGNWN